MSAPYKQVVLQRQLSDLGGQRINIDLWRGRNLTFRSENLNSAGVKLLFPCRYLLGMDLEMFRQLGDGPVALD